MLTIETTRGCGQTPRILCLLEELGEPYRIVLREDQYFLKTFGRPGPLVHDQNITFRSALTAFRHLARTRGGGRLLSGDAERQAHIEEVIDVAWLGLGMGVVNLLNARKTGVGLSEAEGRIRAALRDLEADLGDRELMFGELCAADCALLGLGRLGALIDLSSYPALARYAARLSALPSAAKARRAVEAAQAEQVLEFWFGALARSEQEVRGKIRRWFQGGAEMDAEISARFKPLVEEALAGGLVDWEQAPRTALALILVLDQFTRQVFRGQGRAHDGDARAVRIARSRVEAGDLELDQDLARKGFLLMPLLHSESLADHELHSALVAKIAETAPADSFFLRAMREQTQKYLSIIQRFGRFPHRNAVLGRESSADEVEFLHHFAEHGPPQVAREIEAEALRC